MIELLSAETRARDAICCVGQSLFERGYVHATAGNISVRLDDGFLITPTDACLGTLVPERLAEVAAGRATWRQLCSIEDEVTAFALDGHHLYLLTTRAAENGKVLRVACADGRYADAATVVPEGKLVVEGMALARDGLYLLNLDGGYLDDYEVRKALYWSLFAGAHGHTYGCWPIWCMWRPGLPQNLARRPWYEALHLPGSGQMRHARNLLLSRPFLETADEEHLAVESEQSL